MRQITHQWQLITVGILLALGLSSCTPPGGESQPEASTKPKVVATSTIIADLAAKVGGEDLILKGILQPGADPHVYEPVPTDSVALEKADLILYNGYNLEPGLIKLMNAAGVKAKKFAVGEVVKPLDFNKSGKIEPDPHVWGSAKNGIEMVKAIRDRAIEVSPQHRDRFTKNADKLIARLQKLDTWIQSQINTIPADRRYLVTTHDAFQYYARDYGLQVLGTLIGISTEEQPSAQTVKNLANTIKQTKVKTIFAETTINPVLIKSVAEEAGVKLASQQLYSDSIGALGSDGDDYIKMLVANTRAIVEGLGGKYTEFTP
jgi:manganese/iron transport system substrate-binding protein